MSRPSEPLLRWLRRQIDARGHNTATLAEALGRPRSELRRALTGADPLMVDDLLRLTEVLELSAEDMGVPVAPEADASLQQALEAEEEGAHWRNQPEALLRMGFDLGIDMVVLLDGDAIPEDWGGPEHVRRKHEGRALTIQLLALYHRHMNPRFEDGGIHVKLGFDALYDCILPWRSIQRVVFDPYLPDDDGDDGDDTPDEPEVKDTKAPHLKLVT